MLNATVWIYEEHAEAVISDERNGTAERIAGKHKEILPKVETVARGYADADITLIERQTPAACHWGGRYDEMLRKTGARYKIERV